MADKIGALVLTMNRKKMVTECINSLIKEKLDKIIIVDNGSSDGTIEHIKTNFNDKKMHLISLKKNIGSAGGYNVGLKEAQKIGLDWVWFFDDDCEAMKGSLKSLIDIKKFLNRQGEKIGFIASKLNWIGGGSMPVKIDLNSKKWADYLEYSLLRISWSMYTGLFVNMNSVKKNGLPKKEFFIYEDDTDFTYRLTEGYSGFLFGKSQILHKDKIKNRRGYLSMDSKNFNRYKYAVRNGTCFAKLLFKKNKKEGIIHFMGVFKNLILTPFFSKKIIYSPVLLAWLIKGFFFNPKITY